MSKSFGAVTVSIALLSLLALNVYEGITHAQAQGPAQYPILDMVASKVIQTYQQSTCEQLWQKKSAKAPPSAEEQKIIGLLKSDPKMRTVFIDKVAAPIANKMFECGMIP